MRMRQRAKFLFKIGSRPISHTEGVASRRPRRPRSFPRLLRKGTSTWTSLPARRFHATSHAACARRHQRVAPPARLTAELPRVIEALSWAKEFSEFIIACLEMLRSSDGKWMLLSRARNVGSSWADRCRNVATRVQQHIGASTSAGNASTSTSRGRRLPGAVTSSSAADDPDDSDDDDDDDCDDTDGNSEVSVAMGRRVRRKVDHFDPATSAAAPQLVRLPLDNWPRPAGLVCAGMPT
eukprot:COSAG01_NODE_10534_length_2138_cov_429.838567_2_plen_238_part_00